MGQAFGSGGSRLRKGQHAASAGCSRRLGRMLAHSLPKCCGSCAHLHPHLLQARAQTRHRRRHDRSDFSKKSGGLLLNVFWHELVLRHPVLRTRAMPAERSDRREASQLRAMVSGDLSERHYIGGERKQHTQMDHTDYTHTTGHTAFSSARRAPSRTACVPHIVYMYIRI